MATAARSLTRTLPRATSSAQYAARAPAARQFFAHARRQYPSDASKSTNLAVSRYYYVAGASALAFGAGYLLSNSLPDTQLKTDVKKELGKIPDIHLRKGSAGESIGLFTPTQDDYQKVYNAIAKQLWEKDEYDDGSYGPVLLRLAWHASGTYDAETGTGGSNGATMRFAPEGSHGANAGLKHARDFLEPIKEAFPWISYSDLWTLAGVCAVQEMQGPVVPWRPGRKDKDEASCTPDGRLPDASKAHDHIRAIFGRMGFNDQEMVALSGAHALGRCHTDRSGFDGPWTFSPTILTNDYFKLLMEEKWGWRKWAGPRQYEDVKSKSLMMLPTDMALINDDIFREQVYKYAENSDLFFKDFASVVTKLFELGVPFEKDERLHLKTFDEQHLTV